MIESGFFPTLQFALSITGPIFLMVFLGVFFKRSGLINDNFIQVSSRLVFTITLPTLLFLSIIKTDIRQVVNVPLLLLGAVSTCAVFGILSVFAPMFVSSPRDRGVFVQGGFRGNLGIVGIAFCANAYGPEGLAAASMLMAVLTLLYNVLSVYTLNRSLLSGAGQGFGAIVMGVVKNPLIIAIVLALVLNIAEIQFHNIVLSTGEYFAKMTLPLALLCIGGTLSMQGLRQSTSVAAIAVVAKLVIAPVFICYAGYLYGFRDMDLGILFLMASSPTAAASYVMVQALKGNGVLAANIVVISTLLSLLSVSVGLVLLKSNGLI